MSAEMYIKIKSKFSSSKWDKIDVDIFEGVKVKVGIITSVLENGLANYELPSAVKLERRIKHIELSLIEFPPEAPSNLDASLDDNGNIVNLLWEDNSRWERGFRIERKVDDGSFILLNEVDRNTNTYQDDISSLKASLNRDFTLYYRVQAINEKGKSEFTNVAMVEVKANSGGENTAPNPPTDLTLSFDSQNNTITLQWVDNANVEYITIECMQLTSTAIQNTVKHPFLCLYLVAIKILCLRLHLT